MESISHRESYIGKIGDKRLERRAMMLSAQLFFEGDSSIHAITTSEKEQKGAYRLLSNDFVEEGKLIKGVTERSSYLCEGRHILAIQDSSETNFEAHRGRIKAGTGMGLTGNNKDLGFFLHATLVLDAGKDSILGFSDIQLWHRPEGVANKRERGYQKLPVEKKESYKWIKACENSKKHLSAARSITFIEDREGDIYEQFAMIPDACTHLIIRSRDNRKVAGGSKLFETLKATAPAGTYAIELVKDIRQGKAESRTATVEVRFCQVSIIKPESTTRRDIAKQVQLYAVEVKEADTAIATPVVWRLLTTHQVNSYEQALVIINNYRQRWHIEQLFRLMKKKGFNIENSELETGWAIRKLTVMILNAALRIMQLMLAHDNGQSQPAEEVFDEGQRSCLKILNSTLQGDTPATANKHDPRTLAWASWIIARLGGWKPCDNKRPPGPIT